MSDTPADENARNERPRRQQPDRSSRDGAGYRPDRGGSGQSRRPREDGGYRSSRDGDQGGRAPRRGDGYRPSRNGDGDRTRGDRADTGRPRTGGDGYRPNRNDGDHGGRPRAGGGASRDRSVSGGGTWRTNRDGGSSSDERRSGGYRSDRGGAPQYRGDRPERGGSDRDRGRSRDDRQPRSNDGRPAREWKPRSNEGPAREWKPRSNDGRPAREWKPRGDNDGRSREWKPRGDDRQSREWKPRGDGGDRYRAGGDRGRSNERPTRSGDGPRSGGFRNDRQGRPPQKDGLWTRDGRPARGDRDARDESWRTDEEAQLARELQSVRPRHDDPLIPEDIQARDLPGEARVELKTLSKDNADWVAKHLVMASRLIETDPELAHQHALSAARRAGRVAVVRETLAITAYAIGDFALALRELRTYRRISGSNDQLPLMVDSERGVGRPDRALELGRSVDRATLPADVQVSLAIAMSGARLDLEQPEAALAELEIPQLDPTRAFSYSADLFHAYAEVLEELGRDADAARWRELAQRAEEAFERAHATDELETIDVIEEEVLLDPEEFSDEAPLSEDELEVEALLSEEGDAGQDDHTDDEEGEPTDGPVSTEQ